jgi:hypothetical protein
MEGMLESRVVRSETTLMVGDNYLVIKDRKMTFEEEFLKYF